MVKKIVATVDVGNHVAEIFRCEERKDGSVNIYLKKSHEIDNCDSGIYRESKEMRISIHPNNSNEHITVNNHFRTSDGIYRKIISKILPLGDLLIWPCHACSVADLSQDHYKYMKKKEFVEFSIKKYDPRYSVLTFFIVIASRNYELENIFKMNMHRELFDRFSVYILYSFMCSTSFYQGEFSTPGIIVETKDGENINEYRHAEMAQSLDKFQLRDMIYTWLGYFSARHVEKLLSMDGFIIDDENMMRLLAGAYSLDPIEILVPGAEA